MTFSVEVRNSEAIQEEAQTVHLFLGLEDIEMLIASLEAMRDDLPRSNPLTLFSQDWGNGALSTEKVIQDAQITHCLKITKFER
ncbi:hypothetical protein [uncultured Shimia sp.]|uniref:hypothetical protein n=1 Tax=uncultured Shimia sp. TaxID=573152 RepID=UPI0025E153B8|nr:hypothetical protein [uncultured Shimia sp.]